jgi:hypothetical protein
MMPCTFTHWLKRAAPMREAASAQPLGPIEYVMARKKISTTIYITPEQNESLKLLHDRTKVPIAVYIREGIDLVLERHQSELPGQLTLVSAASGDKKG